MNTITLTRALTITLILSLLAIVTTAQTPETNSKTDPALAGRVQIDFAFLKQFRYCLWAFAAHQRVERCG